MKLILLLTFIVFSSFSQNILNPEKVNSIEIDIFDNIYILSSKNNIKKYINDSNNILEYTNLEYGEITKIITENPFRVIIFFKDNQNIVFLDKNLNELNYIINLNNLFDEKIVDISNYSNLLFFLSEINEIFIYDITRNEIINSKKLSLINQSRSIKIFSNNNKIFIVGNSFKKILNHELNYIFDEKNQGDKNVNKLIFDENKIYECSKDEGKTTIFKLDDNFKKSKIKSINDSIFNIRKNMIITINKGILEQHPINN
tara:strand:- start:612 stop:1385 length:774 start_codon:yes stop_codon:yes gene_type:complete